MTSDHRSIEFSDNEYESSSDGGLSAESSEISSDLAVFPRHRVINQIQTSRSLIKWSLPPPSATPVPLPGWKAMPYGLEKFWQSAFCWFFRPFLAAHGHLWTLEPTELPPLSVEWPWHSTSYLAKVRFHCKCTRSWTSMKGRVAFWFRIRRQGDQVLCEALFKLFGQKCSRCNQEDSFNESEFLTPLWYPEEIENAISFLVSQVMATYYGGQRNTQDLHARVRFRHSLPRKNSPTVHHDLIRCQACFYGLCAISRPLFNDYA